MNIKKMQSFFTLHRVAAILILIVIGLLVFRAGVYVGYKKAGFSRELGNSYFRVFGGGGERMGIFMKDDVPGGHGVAGRVIEVSPISITVEGRDKVEKTVTMSKETMIRKFRDMASSTAIKVNDMIVVIGSPGEDGDIKAKLIRILPPPPFEMATSTQN